MPLLSLTNDGSRGRDGGHGARGATPTKLGYHGADGSAGEPGATGENGGSIYLHLSPDRDESAIVINAQLEGQEPAQYTLMIQDETNSLELSSCGGPGGNGGCGGAGGDGSSGVPGENARANCTGTNGGRGGNGGNGCDGGAAGDGGAGGMVVVAASENDTDMFMLVKAHPLVNGGLPGAGGTPGEEGNGAPGGKGGQGFSYTQRSTRADGVQITSQKYSSGGHDGAAGRPGKKGRRGPDGKRGQDGRFLFRIVTMSGQEVDYPWLYSIRLVLPSVHTEARSGTGILEPGSMCDTTLVVGNTGEMPTPARQPTVFSLLPDDWVYFEPHSDCALLTQSIARGHTASTVLRWQVCSSPGPTVGNPLHETATLRFEARMRRVNQIHPAVQGQHITLPIAHVAASSIAHMPAAIALSEETPLAVAVHNASALPLGLDAEPARVLSLRIEITDVHYPLTALTPFSLDTCPYRLYDAVGRHVDTLGGPVALLAPHADHIVAGSISFDACVPAYSKISFRSTLELGDVNEPLTPNVVQYRDWHLVLAEKCDCADDCEILLVTNSATSAHEVVAWRNLCAMFGRSCAVWNIDLYDCLRLGRSASNSNNSFFERLRGRLVVVLNNERLLNESWGHSAMQSGAICHRELLHGIVYHALHVYICGQSSGIDFSRLLVPALPNGEAPERSVLFASVDAFLNARVGATAATAGAAALESGSRGPVPQSSMATADVKGFMRKRGGQDGKRSYKMRYWALFSNLATLAYYKDPTDTFPLGMIWLRNATLTCEGATKLIIRTPERTFFLDVCARSKKLSSSESSAKARRGAAVAAGCLRGTSRDVWVSSLNGAIEMADLMNDHCDFEQAEEMVEEEEVPTDDSRDATLSLSPTPPHSTTAANRDGSKQHLTPRARAEHALRLSQLSSLSVLSAGARVSNRQALSTMSAPGAPVSSSVSVTTKTTQPSSAARLVGPANSAEADYAGYLRKRGAPHSSAWKRRWFVLRRDSRTLAYYETATSTKPKGVISLERFTLLDPPVGDSAMAKGCGFLLATPMRTYRIACCAKEHGGASVVSAWRHELQRDPSSHTPDQAHDVKEAQLYEVVEDDDDDDEDEEEEVAEMAVDEKGREEADLTGVEGDSEAIVEHEGEEEEEEEAEEKREEDSDNGIVEDDHEVDDDDDDDDDDDGDDDETRWAMLNNTDSWEGGANEPEMDWSESTAKYDFEAGPIPERPIAAVDAECTVAPTAGDASLRRQRSPWLVFDNDQHELASLPSSLLAARASVNVIDRIEVKTAYTRPARPQPRDLERRALRIATVLREREPARRVCVVYTFNPVDIPGGILRRRMHLGTIEVRRSVNNDYAPVVFCDADDAQLHSGAPFVHSAANLCGVLKAMHYFKKLDILAALPLRFDAAQHRIAGPLVDAIISDLMDEQACYRADSPWAGAWTPRVLKHRGLTYLRHLCTAWFSNDAVRGVPAATDKRLALERIAVTILLVCNRCVGKADRLLLRRRQRAVSTASLALLNGFLANITFGEQAGSVRLRPQQQLLKQLSKQASAMKKREKASKIDRHECLRRLRAPHATPTQSCPASSSLAYASQPNMVLSADEYAEVALPASTLLPRIQQPVFSTTQERESGIAAHAHAGTYTYVV